MRVRIDKEAGAAYIYLTENRKGRVGTIEVQGYAKYRKPPESKKISGVLLDFDEDKKLVGIELIGLEYLPEELKELKE